MSLTLRTVEVSDLAEDRQRARLDALLTNNRRALVPRGARLESIGERVSEATTDPCRILVGAWLNDRPMGLLDARFGWPEPGDVVIEQLAVHRSARRRGYGRALVQTALGLARVRFAAVERVLAAVLDPHGEAAHFWEGLGLHPQPGVDAHLLLGAAEPLLPPKPQVSEDAHR